MESYGSSIFSFWKKNPWGLLSRKQLLGKNLGFKVKVKNSQIPTKDSKEQIWQNGIRTKQVRKISSIDEIGRVEGGMAVDRLAP
jgi:hypothetical protein